MADQIDLSFVTDSILDQTIWSSIVHSLPLLCCCLYIENLDSVNQPYRDKLLTRPVYPPTSKQCFDDRQNLIYNLNGFDLIQPSLLIFIECYSILKQMIVIRHWLSSNDDKMTHGGLDYSFVVSSIRIFLILRGGSIITMNQVVCLFSAIWLIASMIFLIMTILDLFIGWRFPFFSSWSHQFHVVTSSLTDILIVFLCVLDNQAAGNDLAFIILSVWFGWFLAG